LHGRQLLYLHVVENHSSTRVSGGAYAVHLGPRASRGRDLSCEVETSRAKRRLVVRVGGLSCEAETRRARRRLLVRGGDLSWGSL
jgi:hypothetical protein